MEELQGAEVELDLEAVFVQFELPVRCELLHRLVRFDETPAFVLDVHLTLKLLRAVARIRNDDAGDILVDLPEDSAVVAVCSGERKTKDAAVIITGHGHFEAEVEAFSRVAPRGKAAHGAMVFAVLQETNRNVGRIRELHEMLLHSIHAHEVEQDTQCNHSHAIDRDDERLVRTDSRKPEVIKDRLLRCSRRTLFVQGERQGINLTDC